MKPRKEKRKENIPNKRKKYTHESLQTALDAVKKGMSKKLASKTFNVPRGTIQSRLRKPCQNLPGPKPILSDEEERILAQWLVDCYRKGFPKRKSDLQLSVANFLKKTGRDNPFKDNIPGKKWYDLFMRRHPELAERTAEAVSSASANVSEKDIKGWFQKIELYLKENNYFDIFQEPSRVFNGDESNFQLCPKTGRVIALRGEKDVYEVDHAAAKTALTVLFTFGADGDVTPPLVVFPNKRLPKDITSSVPSEWGIGLSDSGWMKCELFYDYIKNVLHPYLIKRNVTFPVILFVDGHKTHLTLEVSELCSKLEIVLIALYPNASRILQPADVSAFRPLKVAWKKSVLQWRRDHPLETLTKNNFVPVLKQALEVGVKDSTVRNGFRATGLCPWNPEAINYSKCLGKGSKHDDEPKEDISKPQGIPNGDIVMTAETLKNIVTQEKFTFLQRTPLESLTETEGILKKICCYFENHQNDAPTSQKSISETDNNQSVESLPINQMPVILFEDYVAETRADNTAIRIASTGNNTVEDYVAETRADNTAIRIASTDNNTVEDYVAETRADNTAIRIASTDNNTVDCFVSQELVYVDSQQYLLTPVKIQDVLVKENTPVRKGVKNVKRSSFVLTSAEWQKNEKDKLIAKKTKEEEQETRKRNRLLKQQEKNKIKTETTRNKTNKIVKETKANKIQETKDNKIQRTKANKLQKTNTAKIQETKKQDSQQMTGRIRNDSSSSDDLSTIQQDLEVSTHQVMIHNNNIPSLPENEHPSDIKKRKAEEQAMVYPNKKIQVISDIVLNSSNVPRTSQVGRRDDKLIGDPLNKKSNNEKNKTYSLLDLEKIFSEDFLDFMEDSE